MKMCLQVALRDDTRQQPGSGEDAGVRAIEEDVRQGTDIGHDCLSQAERAQHMQ